MKHPLLIIAICLLLGAVVNVAVAWGCAVWSPVDITPGSSESELVKWPGPVPEGWPPLDWWQRESGFGVDIDYLAAVDMSIGAYAKAIYDRGWPYRSLRAEWKGVLTSTVNVGEWRGGLNLPWRRPGDELPLPLKPLWPGFAINTIFYAAILWLLIPGPCALRRLVRRRRGLCPACGYDLGHAEHDTCPECGVAYRKLRHTAYH